MTTNASRHCVIRADASAQLGGGHILRCLVLADALTSYGWKCSFATRETSLGAVRRLQYSGHEIVILRSDEQHEADEILAAFLQGCDLLIVDHYHRGKAFEQQLCKWAQRIFVIEDLLDRSHQCNFLLDQTHSARPAEMSISSVGCQLVGQEFALLRRSFSIARLAGPVSGRIFPPRRILIQTGLSDLAGLAVPLTLAARAAFPDALLAVVLGSMAASLSEIRQISQCSPGSVALYIDEEHMDDQMRNADLMLGAAGSSCWEACCLGLPMALVQVAENQQPVIELLTQRGAAICLGTASDILSCPDDIIGKLTSLTAEHLMNFSTQSSRICDGLGVNRVLLTLLPELTTARTAITLRPVQPGDSSLLFQWQVDPSTRRFFRDPSVPTAELHASWFSDRLASDKGPFCLIMHLDQPVGVIRLDRLDSARRDKFVPAFEVSLIISPEERGKGIGSAALRAACRLVDGVDVVAHIFSQNEPSIAAFASAGFLPDGSDWFRLKARDHG
ncbi:MAG: UDP-2,4-diacetamido-2,4,6-trideoxy-beta-L-altropyranose hydrolase [Alphaproteobacteria bacterium]|nr:UDP-2,4-diacetamido-2,4,6-trideoxy-beta-L-altropyranose hydrolase [Alphaproteobacteria bacterium]